MPVNARPDAAAVPTCAYAAREIVDAGLWCTVELCTDVPAQAWEPRLVICRTDLGEVLEAVEGWIHDVPECDARIAGYTRGTLRRVADAPVALCHVVGASLVQV